MIAFCTYCSREKSHEPGNIPAIRRYRSARIDRVFCAASMLKLGFFILSGQYGLLRPCDCIPWYDHLLRAEEVSTLADTVSAQCQEHKITKLIYFTKPLTSSNDLYRYHDCLVAASSRISLPLIVLEMEEQENE